MQLSIKATVQWRCTNTKKYREIQRYSTMH